MRVLAIDASTKSSGLALFDDINLIKYDCFTSSSTDLIKRIFIIISKLKNFLTENQVDKIILEEIHPETGINLQTYRALMWLQAAINFLIHERFPNIKIEYTYPSQWRAACGIKTGRGKKRETLKQEDINFAQNTYGILVNDDIADAIGIGHAYVNQLEDGISFGQ